ncbi:barstar family protein [Burkholderia guangdongensis]|uniref:barstar family protein n=1 Tax=Burkholderia guangdongensis TaxID=1792500 RepID=UPI0015C77911|nr:barstar family protein [Burkholderia guangdongensis]
MSDSIYAHDTSAAAELFAAGDGNLFQRVMQLRVAAQTGDVPAQAGTEGSSSNEEPMSLFATVRPNLVQSIRAFRVQDLADEAGRLGQHFLYAFCGAAQSKQEVLETISTSFLFPKHFGKNYDALYDCLTDLVHKAGEQPGFVIVLEALPIVQKFDKEGRETLLDVFREAAEFWAERKVAFRVFYSFA